ncbi:hypothetical protein R1flu_025288 [Riccia fluitans]|uniref:Uncharacterized protein n=1 Tax=Riccia fluitans TaxID=41844 RepID=A0ABD1XXB8_9MARC
MEDEISHCRGNNSKTHSKSIRFTGDVVATKCNSNVYCYGYGVGTLSTSRLSANFKLLSEQDNGTPRLHINSPVCAKHCSQYSANNGIKTTWHYGASSTYS